MALQRVQASSAESTLESTRMTSYNPWNRSFDASCSLYVHWLSLGLSSPTAQPWRVDALPQRETFS
jgi:hypothetical protein